MEARALLWGISPPLQQPAGPPLFPKASTLTAEPRIGPSPRLPAWLSSTADVHRGMTLDDWIPRYRGRGRRRDKERGLDGGLVWPRYCVCEEFTFPAVVHMWVDHFIILPIIQVHYWHWYTSPVDTDCVLVKDPSSCYFQWRCSTCFPPVLLQWTDSTIR